MDDQIYVIKQIDTVALHPDELQQAVVEAQVLAALDNRYIIQYCDSFVDKVSDDNYHPTIAIRRIIPPSMSRTGLTGRPALWW